MIGKCIYFFCVAFWLLAAGPLFSQSAATVNASVDKSEIIIGERIKLSLDLRLSLGLNPVWFQQDSIPHFDLIEKGRIDSVLSPTGEAYHQEWILTSFDSGIHIIPSMAVVIGGKKFYTDSIPVTVKFTPLDPKQDYHDIKDIVDVRNPYSAYILWSVAILTFISGILAFYFITRKQRERSVAAIQETNRLNPFDEAIKALETLKKERLPEKGETKQYYSRMNDILRVFIMRRFGVSSMEKTNEEIILQLRDQPIPKEQFSRLSQALRISDFVKFAKYLPGASDNEEHFQVIRSCLDILNEIR
jgi:hypothetical protein